MRWRRPFLSRTSTNRELKELEADARAVLGNSDAEHCTWDRRYSHLLPGDGGQEKGEGSPSVLLRLGGRADLTWPGYYEYPFHLIGVFFRAFNLIFFSIDVRRITFCFYIPLSMSFGVYFFL